MRIGRYTLTAVAAVVIGLVGWVIFQAPAQRPAASLRRPAVIARPAPAVLPPTARDILDGGALLDLKAEQRTRLRTLDARWVSESASAEAELTAAADEFSRFMDEARATGRTSLQEIQRRSAEISGLSAALREQRRLHTIAAAEILTEWQRSKLGEVTRAVAAGGQR